MSTEAVPPNALSHMDIEANLLQQAKIKAVSQSGVSNTELEAQMKKSSEEQRRKTKKELIGHLGRYFSRQNLHADSYLRSQMNSGGWVPVNVIATFKLIKQSTNNMDLLKDAMRDCPGVTLNAEETHARAQGGSSLERTTLILREISADTPREDVEAIFKSEECAPIKRESLRSDIGNTWFVSFDTEDDCVKTAMYLQNHGKFNGKPIQCRVKSVQASVVRYPPRQPASRGGGIVASARNYAGVAPNGYNSQSYGMSGSPTFGRAPYGRNPHPNFMGPPFRMSPTGASPTDLRNRNGQYRSPMHSPVRRSNRSPRSPHDSRASRSRDVSRSGGQPQRSAPSRGQRQRSPDKQPSRSRSAAKPYPENYKHYTSSQIADVIASMISTGFERPKTLEKNCPNELLRKNPVQKLRVKAYNQSSSS